MTRWSQPARPQPLRLGLGLASIALAAVLLVGFKAPDDGSLPAATTTGSGTGNAVTGISGGTGTTGTSGGTSGTSGGSSTASGTIDGTLIETRYGPVQVEITVSNGKVTAATAVALPSGGRSGAISSYASPILSSEAVTAQSASIDLVSGATYTSEAYAQSLQAALDRAGI